MTVLTADAAALLAGSRGRRFCLEYAMAVNPELGQVMFWIAYEAAPERSVLLTFGPDGSEPSPPNFTLADAVALIAATDLREIDTASVRAALSASVDAAMYWQPPDGHDTVCALPEMCAALAPAAEALLASPMATSWKAGHAEEQWAVDWHAPMDAAPLPSNTMALLRSSPQKRSNMITWRRHSRTSHTSGLSSLAHSPAHPKNRCRASSKRS